MAFIQVFVGQTYIIALGSQTQGNSAVMLTCTPVAYDLPNDECTGAIAISDGNTTFDGTRATTPQIFGYTSLQYDQWFAYTATCDGTVMITSPPTPTGIYLYIYDSCGTNAKWTTGPNSVATIQSVVAGKIFYISAGYMSSTAVNASSYFGVRCAGAPINDQRTGAIRITGLGPHTYNTEGATSHECTYDVFFIWTATCTGLARASSCGAGVATTGVTTRLSMSTVGGTTPLFLIASSHSS